MTRLARASTRITNNDITTIVSSTSGTQSPQSPHNRRGDPAKNFSTSISQAAASLKIPTHRNPPPVIPQSPELNPEPPSTIPDSLKTQMTALGSQSEGDTQPISQGVIEEYNNRSKLQDVAKPPSVPNEGTCETPESTERSYHPGQTGHVDLVGAFEQPSRMSGDESSGEDEDFDPLSPTADVRAELYPESKRFQLPKTPATNGKKRNRAGELINHENSTVRLPLNPFAGQMIGLDTMMNASQAFKATQAPSSPLGHVLPSDGFSQRPSPDMYNNQRPSTADPPSSPSKTSGLGIVRGPTEPQTKYVSMQESQAERDRLARRTCAALDKGGSESSDDFGSDNSQLRRRRLQKKIALDAKNQFDGITAPARPGSSSRRKKNLPKQLKEDSRHRPGRQPSNALIISDDLPVEGNITEDETEHEEDRVESEVEELDELADENKENVDVPMTVSKNDERKTQILASQSTPSRQHHQRFSNTSCTDQAGSSSGMIHGSVMDRDGFVDTQTSAVTDSQSSHSFGTSREVSEHVHLHIQLSSDARESTSKAHSFHTSDFPISVPSSSPTLAMRSQAVLASDQHKKPVVFRDERPTNQSPTNCVQTQTDSTLQPPIRSSQSKISSSGNHPNTKMPDQHVGLLVQQAMQFEAPHIPQPAEPNKIVFGENHSSPLSEVPTATPPSTKKISPSEYIDETIPNSTVPHSTQFLPKVASKPSSQLALPELSTGSTPFETARTSLVDSKLNHQYLQHHSGPATSSPGLPLRSLAQIAADPSPPDAVGEVDVDINLLTNDDIEFQAIISGSSPIGPRRRRRRDHNGHSTESTDSMKTLPSRNLNQDLEGNAQPDISITDELASGSPVLVQQTNKNNDVSTTPSSPNHDIKIEAPTKIQSSRGRPRKSLLIKDAAASKAFVVEKKSKDAPDYSRLEITLPITNAAPPLRRNDPKEGAIHKFVAPDRVFAHFNGNFPAFYPATCLYVEGDEQSRFKVLFDDGTKDVIRGFGIKRLELRVGDNVKVNLNGSRTKTYVVQRLIGSNLSSNEIITNLSFTDVYGNLSVVVTAKERQSVGGSNEQVHEISVPIKDVYLTQAMWTHFKDRPYSYTSTIPKAQTPSEQSSTPSTPPSREYRTKTSEFFTPRLSKTVSRSGTGLFENMVFAITNIAAEDDRKRTTRQIVENGGQILDDGFDELFDIPSLELASPTKHSPKNLIGSKFGLSQSAQSFGFTCLIADKHSRKAKYIQALALGIPCLATRWVQDCVKKKQTIPWEAYLLPSGESSFLGGAIRSRILPSYLPLEATLPKILEHRPKLLDGDSVLLIMSKNEEDRMKFYPFFTHALGASRVFRSPSLDAAAKAINKARADGEPWDWIYSHDNEKKAEKILFGSGSFGRKRKRGRESDVVDDPRYKQARLVGNEFVIQSLILGQLVD